MAFEEITVQHHQMRVKIGIGLVFLLAFLSMFLNVQYSKKKSPILSKTQYNVLTFHQSFGLYVIFFLSELLLKILRDYKNDTEMFDNLAISCLISKLVFFHCLVPLMMTMNLKLKMPLLFSKNKIKKFKFFMSGLSNSPRQQVLLPLKQFDLKARWGSEAKFQLLLMNQSEKVHLEICLPSVECWYFFFYSAKYNMNANRHCWYLWNLIILLQSALLSNFDIPKSHQRPNPKRSLKIKHFTENY